MVVGLCYVCDGVVGLWFVDAVSPRCGFVDLTHVVAVVVVVGADALVIVVDGVVVARCR